ncbi:hypothetical protein PYW07_010809 [Mythimna separata]|uniref:Uncharacterized protein n=1 Tax=Mythimna separata TaxID=271217 RepID=A0AAD7Y858_MYTSE|nr:hypothetical protein PYW07_010809 [Mythimna separata]
MLAMLVVATALLRVGCVSSRASNEDQFVSEHISKIFGEDDMTPDFTEQLGSHDHTRDIKKRHDGTSHEKYAPPQSEVKTTLKPATEKPERNLTQHPKLQVKTPKRGTPTPNAPEEGDKKPHGILHEEVDVVDREDHVTQYLSDQLVNTDSEITSLQASESDDDNERSDSVEVKEDGFFAFLTGQEKAAEVEGA